MSNWIFAAILIAYGLINVFGAMGAEGQNKRWPLLGSFFGLFMGGVFLFLALSASNHRATPTPVVTPTLALATEVPTRASSSTPEPSRTPRPTANTSINASIVNTGVNVRSGPGIAYNVVGGLVANDVAQVIGRNSDGTWLEIIMPKGTHGWVNAAVVKVSGATSGLPVVTPQPTTAP